jgi:hypothetical protein
MCYNKDTKGGVIMSKYDEGFCEYPTHVTESYVKAAELTKKLGCSLSEAFEILAEDKKIDKMSVKEAQSDLTSEQKKAVKKATITGSKKKVPVKRERKVDRRKQLFIDVIFDRLCGMLLDDKPVKVNESEIHFTYIGENYTVKLIKHRPPKK